MAGGLFTVGELLRWLWWLCVADLGIWCARLPSVDGSWICVAATGGWICVVSEESGGLSGEESVSRWG
ncbi:hypothetical protein OIU74_030221 [Salix koriyanagi]|uniref:Secreted protein n=1 Tax=Salix koriyanagi TaxID=2511006 RepID=A0A9Q0ZV32_9ROSI|nr:hypothetical protein OIU74_030221 [Salix koriyanagi]